MQPLDIVIVGPTGYTHVSGSLHRAALAEGLVSMIIDTAPAYSGPTILRRLRWHAGGRKPFRLKSFSRQVFDLAAARRPRLLITLGQAPVVADDVSSLRALGVRCVNFSTDDPFSVAHLASWHITTLKQYDVVFTPRHSNVEDLRCLPCREVQYLPFAYDEKLFAPPVVVLPEINVEPLDGQTNGRSTCVSKEHERILFVGGADADRAAFFERFTKLGLRPMLVGAYWDRYGTLDAERVGIASAEAISQMTIAAAVNLCIVRRANRDGHVMRSFEIPAVGGFLLAEATPEHRHLFGNEGHAALYFASPEEASEKCRWALAHPGERQRMALTAHSMMVAGGHTYRDRLQTILQNSAR